MDGARGVCDGASERSHLEPTRMYVSEVFELSFHFPTFSLQVCRQPASRVPKGNQGTVLMQSELDS